MGVHHNRVAKAPLMESVAKTHELASLIAAKDYDTALTLRGDSYTELAHVFHSISHALPAVRLKTKASRVAVLNVGGLAPGMNAAARVAIRLGLHRGHTVLGVHGSFAGLVEGEVQEMQWGDVEGWSSRGGAELGISRKVPTVKDRYSAFKIPTICLPASIDNNLPFSELSIGSDSALNLIVDSIDRVRQAGAAQRRAFVVETMGGNCGYLALLSGLSGGAVRVYLHEEGITLKDLSRDVERMVESFRAGQRLFMVVANEKASSMYTSDFLCRLFEQESQDLFDARKVVLGQTQQGGTPSPADRILGTRFAAHAMDWISNEIDRKRADSAVIGFVKGTVKVMSMRQAEDLADWENRRPVNQWWMRLRPILDVLAQRLPAEKTETDAAG